MLKRKRSRKALKKNREQQNVLTILFAIIGVILLFVAYFAWGKKKHEGPKSAKSKSPETVDPRHAKLVEFQKKRDEKHFERYKIYKKLCELYTIEKWCREKVDGAFKVGRWLLFGIVLAGFIITHFENNFLGWSTTDFLKGINAIGVLIFLAFFATSDANDSLMKCYHNSKPATVRYFMKIIIWRYRITTTPEELKKDLKRVFLELKPIIDEIRELKHALSNGNTNTNKLLN